MGEIRVTGRAERWTDPDRAVLEVLVRGDGDDQTAARATAATIAEVVDGALAASDPALDVQLRHADTVARRRWRTRDGIDVGHRGGDAVPAGWTVQRSTTVELTVDADALDAVTALVGALVAGGADVRGPVWGVSDGHAVHDQVRGDAVTDATRRATAYATAAGLELRDLIQLAEPGTRRDDGRPHEMALMRADVGGRADDAPVAIAPGRVQVHAAIDAAWQTRRR